ncbi:MAG: hypothetical protein Ta2E_06060 [Mycoplasmoidaceae bacterium]|nr:MAG: hypothetical protein Ta2E_06060 [Mycoplasmoidaceae bacterium]
MADTVLQNDKNKEIFKDICQKLNKFGSIIISNPENINIARFIKDDNNLSFLKAHYEIMGYSVEAKPVSAPTVLSLSVVVNEEGPNNMLNITLNDRQTVCYCMLYLFYTDHLKLAHSNIISDSFRSIMAYFDSIEYTNELKKNIDDIFEKFKKLNLISYKGDLENDTMITLYPTIEHYVDEEYVNRIIQQSKDFMDKSTRLAEEGEND